MYIKVFATPKAKHERVEEAGENRLRIAVREKPERGAANGRIRELVALHYSVPVRAVRLVNGHRQPSKLFAIDDGYKR